MEKQVTVDIKRRVLELRAMMESKLSPPSTFDDFNQKQYHLSDFLSHDDKNFIINAYKGILKRSPDDVGLEYYCKKLETEKKTKILRELLKSPEGKKNKIKIKGLFVAEYLGSCNNFFLTKSFQDIFKRITQLFTMENHIKNVLTTLDNFNHMIEEIEKDTVNLQLELRKIKTKLAQQEIALENLSEHTDLNLEKRITDWNDFYLHFEDKFRGSRETIKKQFEFYISYLQKIKLNGSVLDIGCGRGEWLDLLKENNIDGIGVDTNYKTVKECLKRNLTVVNENAMHYLRNQPSNTFKAITAFHIVEHLPITSLMSLMDEAFRTLKSGGILIFETPNPLNINVSTFSFHLDLTHKKPLPHLLLENILEFKGFINIKIIQLNKAEEIDHIEEISSVEQRFKGPQDYAAIGYKP